MATTHDPAQPVLLLMLLVGMAGCAGGPRSTPRQEITREAFQEALDDSCAPDYLEEGLSAREISERAQNYILAMGWKIVVRDTCGVNATGRWAVYVSPCGMGDPYEDADTYVHEGWHVCQRARDGNLLHEERQVGYLGAPYRWVVEAQPRRGEIQIRAIWGMPEDKLRDYAAERAHQFCRWGSVYRMGRLRGCERSMREVLEHEIMWGPFRPRKGPG